MITATITIQNIITVFQTKPQQYLKALVIVYTLSVLEEIGMAK